MGFFYGEAKRLIDWSVSTLNALDSLADGDIIDEVGGTYKYYCYVLAEFDPIKASQIYEEASVEQVTQALISKRLYNRPKDANR